jgi:hypothetical protein
LLLHPFVILAMNGKVACPRDGFMNRIVKSKADNFTINVKYGGQRRRKFQHLTNLVYLLH